MDVRSEYESAVKAKEALEEEIQAYVTELHSGTNPGLHGPLVDAEGFPRADVDVFRVRQLRHIVAIKQTDHRDVMNKIEHLLPQVFSAKSSGSSIHAASPTLETQRKETVEHVKPEDAEIQAFARVERVQPGSPAEMAGLQSHDLILRFGTAEARNHRNLVAIKDIVERSIGSEIRVLIRRERQVMTLKLTPQTWNGPGVLGCVFQPE
ncbi:hypothetical protein PsorP6_017317 [Peronosclerospora sorghi]|uniref:Uncharacterized protein n=1 Tax=Peronosclerospora sorghi TaxID=230839 RepID=A0ACC0WKZ2_9STRA|nr:hypothetical protein PsorP6_017317 [Peronosclerospora sorghi]